MDARKFLVCWMLIEYSKEVMSRVQMGRHIKDRRCEFIFSDGDYKEFREAGALFEACSREFQTLNLLVKIDNYFLPAFPNGSFTSHELLDSFRLEIANGSQIQMISPLLPEYFVFENLKFKSAVFDVSDLPTLSGWNWEALSFSSNEQIEQFEFNIVRSKLIYLPSSFGKVANGRVTVIRILKCRLRWLGKNVFTPFVNLINLELRNNFIESIDRSHFPATASKFVSLDLGKNRLQYLSSDIFKDFPLKTIYLQENNIKILDDQIKEMLRDNTLPSIYGALWPCNCEDVSELITKFKNIINILEEQCYINESKIYIKDFMEKCQQK